MIRWPDNKGGDASILFQLGDVIRHGPADVCFLSSNGHNLVYQGTEKN